MVYETAETANSKEIDGNKVSFEAILENLGSLGCHGHMSLDVRLLICMPPS